VAPPETKAIKNRVHLDLTTGADDRDAEIEQLLRVGARRVDIGRRGVLDRSRRSGGRRILRRAPETTLIE
jgi:hypothetical protein